MKATNIIFLVLIAFFSVSCMNKADFRDLKKRNGLWYGSDGKPFSGYACKTDENGIIILESEFRNGLKHGDFKRYHPNGKLSFETEYVNGVSNGISNQYFSDGRIRSLRLLHDSLYIYAGWSESGILRIIREETADTLANGRTVVYDETGRLQSLFQFVSGVKSGSFMTWHQNGRTDMTGSFTKGKSEGMWIQLFPSGKLKGFEIYKDDERVGTWKSFHENGMLRTVYKFSDNRIILQEGWTDKGIKTDSFSREL